VLICYYATIEIFFGKCALFFTVNRNERID
jgi:hypothetical protein